MPFVKIGMPLDESAKQKIVLLFLNQNIMLLVLKKHVNEAVSFTPLNIC